MSQSQYSVKEAVERLPEIYQNIYGYPEYINESSRICTDREKVITTIVSDMQVFLNKKNLKVLDIGCAQGYYSLLLAEMGCNVWGIDYLDKNIDLCNVLKEKNGFTNCRFDVNTLTEEFVYGLHEEYDVILLTSVMHHIALQNGYKKAREIFEKLALHTRIILNEMALKQEPVYWNEYLPDEYEDWFEKIAFFDEQAWFGTHLSGIKRPFIVCSNNYIYLNNAFYPIDEKIGSAFKGKEVDATKRYFFSGNMLIKYFRRKNEIACRELKNEIGFLKDNQEFGFTSKLVDNGESDTAIYEVSVIKKGELLYDMIQNGVEYNREKILFDILENLIQLEKKGLYHGDIRLWNVVWYKDEDKAFLIDFGSIQRTVSDTIAEQMIRINRFSVYDAFVTLVYDTLIGAKYDQICVEDSYDLNYVYNLITIEKRYADFIKSYLLEKDSLDFEGIQNLFYKYIIKKEEVVFTQAQENMVINILLQRINDITITKRKLAMEADYRYKLGLSIEDKSKYHSERIDKVMKIIENLDSKTENLDSKTENLDGKIEYLGGKIENLQSQIVVIHKENLMNILYELDECKREINELKKGLVYRIYKKIKRIVGKVGNET